MKIKSIRFSIKKPAKKRISYAVIKDTTYINGTRKQIHIEDPRIDSINTNVRRGILKGDAALTEVKNLVLKLREESEFKARESLFNLVSKNNIEVYEKFWKDKYQDGDLINEESTRNDILSALRHIEPLSIVTSTKQELRAKLNTIPVKNQRRSCIRINQLLEFLDRGFRIEKRAREAREVDYVTWPELQKILPHIYSEEVRNLAITLWGTGVRLGEAFAPSFKRLKPNKTIFINRQMDLDLVIREIKNRKPHHTLLLPQAEEGYLAWCEVDQERKEELRSACINQIIMAAKKAFPKNKDKQISAHDLRHSFAIHWLGLGASLTQVANALGDTIATVEIHYSGFVMTDEQVEGMVRLLK